MEKNEMIQCCNSTTKISASGTTRANEYSVPIPAAIVKTGLDWSKSSVAIKSPVLPSSRRKGNAMTASRLPQTM